MAEVRIGIGDQELVSIITRSSAERLKLKVGQSVYAVIKSTEVMIAKGNTTHEHLLCIALVAFGLPALAPAPPPTRRRDAHGLRRRLAHRVVPGPGAVARAEAPGPRRGVQLRGLAAARLAARAGRAGRRVRLRRPALDGLRQGEGAGRGRGPRVRAEPAGADRAADQPGADRTARGRGPAGEAGRGRGSRAGGQVHPRVAAEAGQHERLPAATTTGACWPTWCRRRRT